MKPQREDTSPGYKQFWPWFIFGILGLFIIFSIVRVYIIVQQPHQMVTGDYFKKGLAINETKGRQKVARTMDLKFNVEVQDDQIILLVNQPVEEKLIYIFMQHPAKSDQDFTLVFNKKSSTEFFAEYETLGNFNYRIRVYEPDNKWEVLTRWNPVKTPKNFISAND
ncbi:MAG: FixH family protein [Gammaproteobacteria bacterium]|nr:FixH family protein [Gammaproteobacteria bacterium]